MNDSQRFWWRLLVAVTASLMMFGLILVVMPDFTLQGFSLLMYASAEHVTTFGSEAVAYIKLVTAVLGAVMFGWGVTLMFLALGPLRRGSKDAWRMFVVSLAAWFLPDTAYSLLSGFWQNAVLNAGFALMFAIPLAALRSYAAHEHAGPLNQTAHNVESPIE